VNNQFGLTGKSGRLWVIALGTLGVAVTLGTAIYSINQMGRPQTEASAQASPSPAVSSISALGRLEPQGEIIDIAAPSNSQGARISQMMINEGDEVRQGQVLAVLDTRQRLEAALAQAEAAVRVAEANLERAVASQVGTVPAQGAEVARLEAELRRQEQANQATLARLQAQERGQVEVQTATVARNAAELRTAEADFARFQQLAAAGVISASDLDQRRLALETARARLSEASANQSQVVASQREQINEAIATAQRIRETLQEQINQARANLERVEQVRPADIASARAEVERAIATVTQARADLDLAFIRSPVAGRVLKINTKAGEAVAQDKGIIEIGQTSQMIVIAEVYESDISKVKVGQRVDIVSEGRSFTDTLKGSVSQVGLRVGKSNVLPTDPAADVDARVVEVKIRLDPADSQKVAGLTQSKVITKIYY